MGLIAFGSSWLGQTPAGRQQKIDDLLEDGDISRTTWTRYSQVADVDSMMDLLNAPQEAIDHQLDELLKGEFIPPTPFGDLEYALKQVEARYSYEENWGTPQEILDLYLQYQAAVVDLLQDRNTPPAPPTPTAPPAPNPLLPQQLPPVGAIPPLPQALPPATPSFGDQQTGNLPIPQNLLQ